MEKKSNLPYVNVPETIHQPPPAKEVEKVLRALTENILSEADFGFLTGSGAVIEDPLYHDPEDIYLSSPHTDYKYWNGVIILGLLRVAEVLNEKEALSFTKKFFEWGFENLPVFRKLFDARIPAAPWHQYFRMDRLDDCGALGAALIEVYSVEGNEDFLPRIQQTAGYIMKRQDRLEDGTFVRRRFDKTTLWADDLFMSVPFLAQMYKLTGEETYLDEGIRQVRNFHDRLFSKEKQLYHHCFYVEAGHHGVAHWGRANGWVAMAKCMLLNAMPEGHPDRDEVISILLRQILGFSRYQTENGMWRQLLDKEDAWLESSCTAMFTYAVARAVNEGWIDNLYSSVAVRGWEGLVLNISKNGELDNVSTGFNIKQDLVFYYKIPVEPGGAHGLGAALLAATEIYRLKEYRDCIWC